MLRSRVRHLAMVAAVLALSSTAQGYYHFIQYFTRSSPYAPIAAKFDVNSLNNKTVPFLIAEQGPAALASGDTFAGHLVAQLASGAALPIAAAGASLAASRWLGTRPAPATID